MSWKPKGEERKSITQGLFIIIIIYLLPGYIPIVKNFKKLIKKKQNSSLNTWRGGSLGAPTRQRDASMYFLLMGRVERTWVDIKPDEKEWDFSLSLFIPRRQSLGNTWEKEARRLCLYLESDKVMGLNTLCRPVYRGRLSDRGEMMELDETPREGGGFSQIL